MSATCAPTRFRSFSGIRDSMRSPMAKREPHSSPAFFRSRFNRRCRALFFSGHHPLFVEMGMLDRFTAQVTFGVFLDVFAVEVVTVTGVQCAVAGLDDRRVMIGARLGAGRVVFQPSLPLPGLSFVIRDRHRQAIAASFGVVVDQYPVSIAKRDDLGAGTWIG